MGRRERRDFRGRSCNGVDGDVCTGSRGHGAQAGADRVTPEVDDNGAHRAPDERTAPNGNADLSSGPAAGGACLAAAAGKAETAAATPPDVKTAEGQPIDLRPRLLNSGWSQGAVLPPELVARVRLSPGAEAPTSVDGWPAGAWFVVVSQDCDIVYGDCVTDPVAEVVLATEIEKPEMQFEHLRDPRELHVCLTGENGAPKPVAIRARNRGFLDRVLLLTAAPTSAMRAEPDAMKRIAGLLGRRYLRVARPEEFDRRFKSAKGKLGKILQQHVPAVLDILLFIEQPGDLPAHESYSATLWVVLQDEFSDRDPTKTQGLKRQILDDVRRAVQNCKGIDFDTPKLYGRYDISLREYDDLMPLDLGWPRLAAEADTLATDPDARKEGVVAVAPTAAPSRPE